MFLTARQLVMLGLTASIVVALVKLSSRRAGGHAEAVLDDALEETFPASDPTATQDYAIPVNRLDPQIAGG